MIANRELSKLQSDIAVIEQALRTVIEIDPTVTKIFVERPQRQTATLTVSTKNTMCATMDSASAILMQRFPIANVRR